MFIRNSIMVIALMGMTDFAVAQQGTLVPQPMQGGHEASSFPPLPSVVVIPLKWVGGKWVAPFDLINPEEMGGGFPPPGAADMPEGFEFEPMPGGPDGFSEGGFVQDGGESFPDGFAELPEGAQVFGSSTHYVPDYLIIDTSGEFVISLREQTFENLNLTGAHPLMVASHFGVVVPVPVEMLQFYEDEKNLEDITAQNEKILDGGEIVGAIGRQFLESFQAVLDQEARTLTLIPPKMNQGGPRH